MTAAIGPTRTDCETAVRHTIQVTRKWDKLSAFKFPHFDNPIQILSLLYTPDPCNRIWHSNRVISVTVTVAKSQLLGPSPGPSILHCHVTDRFRSVGESDPYSVPVAEHELTYGWSRLGPQRLGAAPCCRDALQPGPADPDPARSRLWRRRRRPAQMGSDCRDKSKILEAIPSMAHVTMVSDRLRVRVTMATPRDHSHSGA